MGMMTKAGFAPDFQGRVEHGEVGGNEFGVFGGWDNIVGGANDESDGDAFEFFGKGGSGDLRVGFGLFGGDVIGGEAAGVVAF